MKDTEKYLEGIKSTGFELEFLVSNSLTKAGWTVINNKYYIDDVVGSAREMDILAYKATLLENGISVYTVLFVSCKKSAKNIWTFLAKDINKEDPNIDWYPISAWTNDVASKFMIDNSNWKFDYTESTAELKENIFTPKKHIFAFQELNKEGGSAQNDRAIFDSIVTLMKAQDYEIRALDTRKKDRSIYFTSLISVVDGNILRINYGESAPTIEYIDSDIYVGRYIINKKETTSRIHFIEYDNLENILPFYNNLHMHNINQAEKLYNSFYTDCLKDYKKTNLFLDQFNTQLNWAFYKHLNKIKPGIKGSFKITLITWNDSKDCPALHVDEFLDEQQYSQLKEIEEVDKKVKEALKNIYHYEGDYYFTEDLPF